MKKFLLLLTLSIAITYSFISRANATTRVVTVNPSKIQFQEDTQTILVEGYLPNPCTKNIRPVVVLVNESTAQLEFAATFRGPFCIAPVGQTFELQITPSDIQKELFNLGVKTGGQMTILGPNGEVLGHIDLASSENLNEFSIETIQAEIFPVVHGRNEEIVTSLSNAVN